MADRSTPNLPSRSFEATSRFYERLGFNEAWRDAGWMILERGDLTVEFFPFPELAPAESSFSCCFRLDDVSTFFAMLVSAGIPEATTGWPRIHRPRRKSWGGTVGALIDPDGSLIRLIEPPSRRMRTPKLVLPISGAVPVVLG